MKVYSLTDPNTNLIRYIGVTRQELRKRLWGHITEARSAKKMNKRYSWLRSLLKSNQNPIISMVEEIPEELWQEKERFWIARFRSEGLPLTNGTEGGDGGVWSGRRLGPKKADCNKLPKGPRGPMPQSQRIKISNTLKARYGDTMPLKTKTEKRCKGPCGRSLPLDDFHFKNKVRETRQARCKACMSDYGKQHYTENRDVYIDRAKERLTKLRADNTKLVKAHLEANACSLCEEGDTRCLKVTIDSDELLNKSTETVIHLLTPEVVICLNCRAKAK